MADPLPVNTSDPFVMAQAIGNHGEELCDELTRIVAGWEDLSHTWDLIDELSVFAAEFVVGEIVFGVLVEVGGELWGNAAMAARATVVAQRRFTGWPVIGSRPGSTGHAAPVRAVRMNAVATASISRWLRHRR